jgi:hypothetical protein
MSNEEEGWIAEFEAAGEDEVRMRLYRGSGMHPEAKFHAAVRWLREQARARKHREEEIRRYVWWTLCAAVLSVIVGLVGLMVTWFGH